MNDSRTKYFNKRILNTEILSIENCPKEHLICPYEEKKLVARLLDVFTVLDYCLERQKTTKTKKTQQTINKTIIHAP